MLPYSQNFEGSEFYDEYDAEYSDYHQKSRSMLSRPVTGRKAYYGAGFGLRLCVLSEGRIMPRTDQYVHDL